MLTISNAQVLLPDCSFTCGGVVCDQGRIMEVFRGGPPHSGGERIDAQGLYLTPGLIDLHVHGGGGYDFMDATQEAFLGGAMLHMRHGTTTLLPTTLACSDDELDEVFACFRRTKGQPGIPFMPGLHLEGPFFSPEQSGAQDPAYLRQPSQAWMEKYGEIARDIARISAAPELPGALALGDFCLRHGILASIAHSDAFYPQVAEAAEHGYAHVTHLYSGMSSLRRVGAYRRLGVLESAYLLDTLSAEIIADGHHLPPELLRLILKTKPHRLLCLVTDAMRGAGMPDGSTVKLGSLARGRDVAIQGGVAMTMDGASFAGSVCTADQCVRTMTLQAGLPLGEAVNMMSLHPARIMGWADLGRITPGAKADMCLLTSDIAVKAVFIRGEAVYSR